MEASLVVSESRTGAGPALGYESMTDERVVGSLATEGAIPSWIAGTLIRNGPALFEDSERAVRHWFDGQAMLHRFTVRDGGVGYANRFLRTRAFTAIRERGKLAYSEFATDPCRSIFKRAMTLFDPGITDNALVNVAKLGERYYAMTEAPLSVEFDPATLETLGYGEQAPGMIATAHPHTDPRSGALVNYAVRFGPRNAYRFYVQPPRGKQSTLLTEPIRRPGYVHSFAMTERYIALVEFPYFVNPVEIPLKGKPFIENFRWEPERGTRVLVWDRDSGERRGRFTTEAGFAFHHVGAWEEGSRLVMEYADHGTPAVIDALYLDKLRSREPSREPRREPPRLRRVTVDLDASSINSELRSEQGIELPRINESHYLQRYRFVYGIGPRSENAYDTADELVKVDNETGAALRWSEPGCYPGEPVFVAAPGNRAEDEGAVMSVVLDAERGRSFLVVLDAGSFEELGRAWAPHAIPHGIHGSFYGA